MVTKFSLNGETQKRLLENFAIGRANYWFAHVADSTSAVFFLLWEFHIQRAGLLFIGLALAAGYLAWTLTEYVFHRWIYHKEQGIFSEGHRLHHEDALIPLAMPWFMTTATVFGLWYLCAVAMGIPLFSSCLAGWLAGFVHYSLVHHSHHHWNFTNPWMRKLKAYHRVHHQLPGCNYGVTMRFWDDVFGTRYRKPAPPESAIPEKAVPATPARASFPR